MHIQSSKRLRTVVATSAGLASLLAAGTASATGFSTARFGGEHGHPMTNNPTALYYNPAGLAEDTPGEEAKDFRLKIFVDGTLIARGLDPHPVLQPGPLPPGDARIRGDVRACA